MEWTDIRLTVAKADADNAEAVATMIAEGGIYIEDYSDIEQQVAEIAHVDLIEQELLDKPRDTVIIHMYLEPGASPVETLALIAARMEAANIAYTVETEGVEQEDWQNGWRKYFDSNWPEQLPYMPAAHGGACYYEDYASEDEGPKNNTTYRNYKSPYQLEAAVADGRAVKADTLEELVAKIYPDDTAAQQTALDSIQRYNELAKAGYDEDFHKPASRMWAVENGPFYADKFTTALLLVCIGGLESDEDCHTFDADRNVIPGLYVAGNIQGNRFATEYPIGLKGVSHSMAMYYGYIAGKNALKDI